MNRLDAELRRLYLPQPATDAGVDAASLFDANGATRALVLELAASIGGAAVERVWRGVQVELELPAPAVAVDGSDGFQLWWSLEAPVDVPRAHAFLEGLCRRFLADVPAECVRAMPAFANAGAPVHARTVPAEQAPAGPWSAFVAPDLAALFVDTPWLDFAPNPDGQADLLRTLDSIDPARFAAAASTLGAGAPPTRVPARGPADDDATPRTAGAAQLEQPEAFLLRVMRDDTVPLALRIEAARALLGRGSGAT